MTIWRKAGRAARAELIAFVDGNLAVPPDLVDRLLAVWDASTGLSCSPPIGVNQSGFWAEVECVFLNTLQARWQLSADSVGAGFAHGKAMLLRRDLLEERGGLRGLSIEVSDDSALTKIVRATGLKVRLVDRPFELPLGRRSMAQVWSRQLRWAQFRRQSFPFVFVCEWLTTLATPLLAGLGLASSRWLADWLDLAEHCGSLVRCRGCSGAGGRLAVEPSLICRLRHSRWDGVGDLADRTGEEPLPLAGQFRRHEHANMQLGVRERALRSVR